VNEDELPWRRSHRIMGWTSEERELWVAKMGREPTADEWRKHIHDLWDEWAALQALSKAEKECRAEAEASKVVSLFPPPPA
jgi:hypothetical protein